MQNKCFFFKINTISNKSMKLLLRKILYKNWVVSEMCNNIFAKAQSYVYDHIAKLLHGFIKMWW